MIYTFGLKELKLKKLKTCNQLVTIQIRNLKESLNRGLVLKKVHGVIKFNQKAWLKSCFDMNTEIEKMQ